MLKFTTCPGSHFCATSQSVRNKEGCLWIFNEVNGLTPGPTNPTPQSQNLTPRRCCSRWRHVTIYIIQVQYMRQYNTDTILLATANVVEIRGLLCKCFYSPKTKPATKEGRNFLSTLGLDQFCDRGPFCNPPLKSSPKTCANLMNNK